MEDFALITEGALYVFVLAEKLDVLAKVRRSRVWIKEQNCLSFQKLTRPRMHTDGTELRTKEQLQSFLISTYNFGQRKNSLLSRITC